MMDIAKNENVIPSSFTAENSDNGGNMTRIDRPFGPGDCISVLTPLGVLAGEILSIGLRSTKLRSIHGTIFIIPNSLMFSGNIVYQ